MNLISKKAITASLGALTLAVGMAAASAPASAGWKHHHGWRGPALGIGVGLALGGALAASRYHGGYYYNDCYIERRPVFNRHGQVVGHRRVRVC